MERRGDLDFHCLECGADLCKEALAAAYDWSEGLPEEAGAFCDGCQADRWFRLSWGNPKLLAAEPIKEGETS